MTAMKALTAALGSQRFVAAFGVNASRTTRPDKPFKINTYTTHLHLLILNDLRNRQPL